MLYPPFNPAWQLGLANALTASGLRIPLPGQGQAIFGSAGVSNYRHANWQGSEPLLSWANNAPPTYGSAFTPYGEKYASYPAGKNGYFAGMLGIADEGPIPDAYQANARLYHSSQGRWLSPDPAGLSAADLANPQTLNRYGYVANNPMSGMDPSGLASSSQSNCPYPCFTTTVIAPAQINYPAWIVACGGWFGNDTDWAGVSPIPCMPHMNTSL